MTRPEGQALNLDLNAGATGDHANMLDPGPKCKSQSEASPDTLSHALQCCRIKYPDVINPLPLLPAGKQQAQAMEGDRLHHVPLHPHCRLRIGFRQRRVEGDLHVVRSGRPWWRRAQRNDCA